MISAIAGTIPPPPAVSGVWTAGAIDVTEAAKISVDGNKVILDAECEFSFVGVDVGGAPVNDSETVTLNPSATVLNDNSNDILRLGDIQIGTYGNTLVVIAGQIKLRSA